LIVFSLHRESLKLILAMDPLPRWFCHRRAWCYGTHDDARALSHQEVDLESRDTW
jgi:hypothetical protein